MQRQRVNGHYRTILLKKIYELKLSETTQRLISGQFVNVDKCEREKLAKVMLNLISDCESERM